MTTKLKELDAKETTTKLSELDTVETFAKLKKKIKLELFKILIASFHDYSTTKSTFFLLGSNQRHFLRQSNELTKWAIGSYWFLSKLNIYHWTHWTYWTHSTQPAQPTEPTWLIEYSLVINYIITHFRTLKGILEA